MLFLLMICSQGEYLRPVSLCDPLPVPFIMGGAKLRIGVTDAPALPRRLFLDQGGKIFLISSIEGLRAKVLIDDQESALAFVRLRTSQALMDVWPGFNGRSGETEVLSFGDNLTNALFGSVALVESLQRSQQAGKSGPYCLVSSVLFKKHFVRSVEATLDGRFLVTRCLVRRSETSGVAVYKAYRVREAVTADGVYKELERVAIDTGGIEWFF